MDRLLEAALYGDVTRSYFDGFAGYENVSSRRLNDVGNLYQGPNMPRPTLTAYRGFQGYKAELTWFFDGAAWRNCFDEMEVWNGL